MVVYEANHDLREVMAEIVAATGLRGGLPPTAGQFYNRLRERRRTRPFRDLQELRIRGQPIHHGVPVLRQSAAQAGAEARSRGPRRREAQAPDRAAAADRLRPARSRASGPTPPYVTIGLTAGVRRALLWRTGLGANNQLEILGKPGTHWWRLFTAVFTYNNTGYAFVALATIALFGWLLERRHGPLAVLGLFLVGGVGGLAATAAFYDVPSRSGPTAPRWRCCAPG